MGANMTIKVHERVLLTGAAGGLGKALREPLKANCETLRLSDRIDFGPAREGEEVVLADLGDADAVHTMVAGVDAIVHMGGVSVEGPFAPILQANILGVYHLYEAARKHGTRRIVFASSNHVMGFYKQSETINADHPPRPDGYYGVSKAFGEDISRFYFDRYGIETACVRIGSSFPEPRDRRMLATWLSYDDLTRLCIRATLATTTGSCIIWGASANSRTYWAHDSREALGWQPNDSADPYAAQVGGITSGNPITERYQGGGYTAMDYTRAAPPPVALFKK